MFFCAGTSKTAMHICWPQPNHDHINVIFQIKIPLCFFFKVLYVGFPGGAVVKNPPANAGDTGSSPGPGRSHMPRSN